MAFDLHYIFDYNTGDCFEAVFHYILRYSENYTRQSDFDMISVNRLD